MGDVGCNFTLLEIDFWLNYAYTQFPEFSDYFCYRHGLRLESYLR